MNNEQINIAYEKYIQNPLDVSPLLESFKPILYWFANKKGLSHWKEDVFQEGSLEILRALKYYDPARGNLPTFIIKHLFSTWQIRHVCDVYGKIGFLGKCDCIEKVEDYSDSLFAKDPLYEIQEIELFESILSDTIIYISKRNPELKTPAVTYLKHLLKGEPYTLELEKYEQDKVEISVRRSLFKNRNSRFNVESVF